MRAVALLKTAYHMCGMSVALLNIAMQDVVFNAAYFTFSPGESFPRWDRASERDKLSKTMVDLYEQVRWTQRANKN